MMNDNPWHSLRRVLAIRLDNLGDVLVTSPAIHAMKESLPSAELTLLVGPMGAQVARLNPDIDDVIVYQAPWMDPWHKPPQDSQREQDALVLQVPVKAREQIDAILARQGVNRLCPLVVVHPGCSMPARTYPWEMYVEVIDLLVAETGATVLLSYRGWMM